MMADFCIQCSVELFGKYFGDMSGLIPPEKLAEGHDAVLGVICEGCGGRVVDKHGNCIDPNCKTHGKQPKER